MRLPKWIRISWNWLRAVVAAKPILSALIPTGMFSAYVGHLASVAAAAPHIVALSAGLAIPVGFTALSSFQDYVRRNQARGKFNFIDVKLIKIGEGEWRVGFILENSFDIPLYFSFDRELFLIGLLCSADDGSPDSDIRVIPAKNKKPLVSGVIKNTPSENAQIALEMEIRYGKHPDELFNKLVVTAQARPPQYELLPDLRRGHEISCIWNATKYQHKAA